jgi:hypothetical protein
VSDSPTVGTALPTADAASTQDAAHQIDIHKLADKVYDLLLADARLGRARSDSPLVSQRRGEG